ncbi:hypothetical protein TRN7648_01683 [Tropicibacter naphthalenivorans]|uniref:Uncharacterized protein n=1 Tax=Tropicibacter naphthalenivorans TaxID=441103 RepID=A0A0P1G8I0_9RHOB|nr:hypothetical protein TRN7648_01683 [Tropicibacter naphthalenivorans]
MIDPIVLCRHALPPAGLPQIKRSVKAAQDVR